MFNHIPAAANCNRLAPWYKHLTQRGHDTEAMACRNFIKWNFQFVAETNDFSELNMKLLIDILLEDDLVIFDEYHLFRCVSSWIEGQSKKLALEEPDAKETLTQMVENSMDCIRFQMMSPRQLADLLLLPVTQKYKSYFMERIAIGVGFHSDINHVVKLVVQHPYRDKLFTARNYCTDTWSVCLIVDNFHVLSHYNSKTLVFSTPVSFSEKYLDKQTEWVVDLYPKGVCFSKFYLIIWQGTVECPDQIMKTVRLSVHCKNNDDNQSDDEEIRVQIGILIAGVENNVEHVKHVINKNYIFSGRDNVLNFDDIIPYDELVKTFAIPSTTNNDDNVSSDRLNIDPTAPSNADSHCERTEFSKRQSSYLCNEDTLKIRIVITPMPEIII